MANSSTVAGIIVVAVVGIIVIFLVLSRIAPRTEEPTFDNDNEASILNEGQPEATFDIDKEISILNEGRQDFAKFSLREADWEVSKKQSEAIEITFVELKDWNEFKENLKQASNIICIDEESRVIWYGMYHVVYIYY